MQLLNWTTTVIILLDYFTAVKRDVDNTEPAISDSRATLHNQSLNLTSTTFQQSLHSRQSHHNHSAIGLKPLHITSHHRDSTKYIEKWHFITTSLHFNSQLPLHPFIISHHIANNHQPPTH